MTNQILNNNAKPKYDLEERTAEFGEQIIDFCQSLRKDNINSPLINQIIRSSTSIGANYMEADAAGSKKDFQNKILISKKEAKETQHWLRMIQRANPELKEKLDILRQEAKELTLIFSKIIINSKSKAV